MHSSSSHTLNQEFHPLKRTLTSPDNISKPPLQGIKFASETLKHNFHTRRPSMNMTSTPSPITLNLSDYELGPCIGQGSSALVYIAKHIPTDSTLAIKVIDLDMFERNQIDELRREIQIMSLSKHSNLLPVYGSFVNGSKLYIIAPLLSAGSCLDIIKTRFKEGFEEVVVATILKQALLGLEYLHKNGLIHRDVKAGNLLVDSDGLVQLADFGVSSSLMETGERKGMRKTFVGTPSWMSPEVMEQSGYDYKADIWSFGITAIELATGHAPYAKFPPIKVLMLTLQNEPPTLDRTKTKNKFSKTFKDMIDSCLQKDPSKRPSADKLLQHAFFKQAKKPNFLVSSIIEGLTPLTQRHRRSKESKESEIVERGVSWDFSSENESSLVLPESKNLLKQVLSLSEQAEQGGVEVGEKELESLYLTESLPTSPTLPLSSSPSLQSQSTHSSLGRPTNASTTTTSTMGASTTQVKKGRFSVMESNSLGDSQPAKLVTFASVDSIVDSPNLYAPERRQSRFAVQEGSTPPMNEIEASKPPHEINRSTSSRFKVSTQSLTTSDGLPPTLMSPSNTSNVSHGVLPNGYTPIDSDTRGRFKISPTTMSPSSFEGKLYDLEMIQALIQGPDLSRVSSLEEKNQILLLHSNEQRNIILQLLNGSLVDEKK